MSSTQTVNDSGKTSNYLDNGFFFILKTLNNFGFEGEIEYILKKDGLQFTTGILDLANPDTDFLTYFGCNVIQNTQIANYKKQIDTSIDVFSTKNLKGDIITPAPTLKFLRKAVPVYSRSKWNTQTAWNSHSLGASGTNITNYYFYNVCNNIVSSDIKNSNSSSGDLFVFNVPGLPPVSSGFYDNRFDEARNFEYIKTQYALTNCVINFNSFNFTQTTHVYNGGNGYVITELFIKWGYDINTAETVVLFRFDLGAEDTNTITKDFNYTIPFLPAGASVWIFFRSKVRQSSSTGTGSPKIDGFASISQYDITIEATTTALDTVISGVRNIDMIKQCSKYINNLPIDAAIFDVGGEYYDNICYGRSLLSPNTANSISLVTDTFPEGKQIGEIVNNTSAIFLALGQYFWNGLNWIFYVEKDAPKIILTSETTPTGTSTNGVILDLFSNGYFFWDGTKWIPMQKLRPFITSVKDCYETAMTVETFSDYEIAEDKIFFGKYADFYKDVEIGRFPIVPSKDFKVSWNDRFKINNFKLAYETYETNRLSKDTANDIHTESEWSVPNIYVENKFERSIKYIRSGYSAQAMVDIETNTPATADENDDKVYINDIWRLEPGTVCQFTANLQMSLDNLGHLKILNRNSTTAENDVIINWQTRGLNIGDTFNIHSGQNTGSYTVYDITNTTLTLTAVGFTPTFSGDSVIEIRYIYAGVFWQTKSDEDFEYVNNLLNSKSYPNLNFSMKRNVLRWTDYLKTANQYHKDKPIKKLFFKNNPLLVTKKINELEITETADFILDINPPILSPKMIDLQVYASFTDILAMMEAYSINRGYITVYNEDGEILQGFAQELDYTWKTGTLNLKLEEKNSLTRFKIFDKTFDNTFN